MWPFRKRIPLKDSGIFEGFTDWHSHILPGVDDGVQTMEEALEILRLYESLGVKSIWLTPHIMEDMPNTTTHLRERYAELQAAYTGLINLHLAAENMLDNLFEERLEKNDLLSLGENGDHLLVETSYFSPPMGLSNILLRIKAKGYYPVLAHPERYVYMGESDYQRLKDMGVKFQLNLPSIVGMYGDRIKKKAKWLMKNNLYDLTGSDTHGLAVLERIIYNRNYHKPISSKPINDKICICENEIQDSLIELKFDRFATKGFFGNSIKCFKKNLMKFSNEEICKYFEVLITKRKELYKESIEMYDNESFTNSHI